MAKVAQEQKQRIKAAAAAAASRSSRGASLVSFVKLCMLMRGRALEKKGPGVMEREPNCLSKSCNEIAPFILLE